MRTKTISILTAFLLSSSCQNQATSPSERPARVPLSYSHEDSLEAREISLWFGATLTPKDSLVDELLYSINYLRYLYKDSTQLFPASLLSERFLSPWATNRLLVKFDSATAELVRSNGYDAWDSLPLAARPDTVENLSLDWTLTRYSDIRNPWRLGELYRSLPGVLLCEPDFIAFVDFGTFPIFPGIDNGEMTYVIVELAPLAAGPRHYFQYEEGIPIYHGVWLPDMDPKPSWWQHARASMDTIYSWGKDGPL